MDILKIKNVLLAYFFFVSSLLNCEAQMEHFEEVEVKAITWMVSFEPTAYFLNYQKLYRKTLIFYPNRINDSNLPETSLINIVSVGEDTTKNYIYPLHKFTFVHNNIETSIIKYRKVQNKVLGKIECKTFVYEKHFGKFIWKEKEIPEIENLTFAIKYIKTDFFTNFNRLNGDSGILPIDKANRICVDYDKRELNIDKLGAYLKTKPKELAPYCDYD